METNQIQLSEEYGSEAYTREFLSSIDQGLDYDGVEVSGSENLGSSKLYTFSKDAFNTYLSVSAREVYDDVMFYHFVRPGRYKKARRNAAKELAEQAGFSTDQEGMAFTKVRPGIIRQEGQPENFIQRLEALDKALYRNAKGDRVFDVRRDLQKQLADEKMTEKIWRKAKKELGL